MKTPRRWATRAHPRSRGEHELTVSEVRTPPGSSPLARGTPHRGHRPAQGAGLIPARAGNTRAALNDLEEMGAHPRSRGEHRLFRSFGFMRSGSSPLARGTPAGRPLTRAARGLIPARAGNTFACQSRRVRGWAHPRSRGEHLPAASDAFATAGSSPLARGTPTDQILEQLPRGLIPARAGNTAIFWHYTGWTRAHPRSRGEHLNAAVSCISPPGSSPLARGTQNMAGERQFTNGLIPARAGNTTRWCTGCGTARAHPRSRGEHGLSVNHFQAAMGSSPLARGTQIFPKGKPKCPGLIPARAGNTLRILFPVSWIGAHPRSRGEH